jgi:hypothetical protein
LAATYPAKCSGAIKRGVGWYWESEDLGEHQLFSRSGDLAARLNERGGKWVLTWPRVFPVQQADTEDAGKGLAISAALAALPPDLVTAASHSAHRLFRSSTDEKIREEARKVYADPANDRPNVNVANQLIRLKLPDVRSDRVMEILREPEFANQRRKPGERRKPGKRPKS